MVEKTCFKCGFVKPLEDFYKHPQMADGHLNKCKVCTRLDVSKNYQQNISHYRDYERKRFQSLERKAKLIRYQRQSRAANPHKWSARQKVKRAIEAGRLQRQPCEVCGNNQSEAHHSDYRKPLVVRWLCFKHHREEHGQKVACK